MPTKLLRIDFAASGEAALAAFASDGINFIDENDGWSLSDGNGSSQPTKMVKSDESKSWG